MKSGGNDGSNWKLKIDNWKLAGVWGLGFSRLVFRLLLIFSLTAWYRTIIQFQFSKLLLKNLFGHLLFAIEQALFECQYYVSNDLVFCIIPNIFHPIFLWLLQCLYRYFHWNYRLLTSQTEQLCKVLIPCIQVLHIFLHFLKPLFNHWHNDSVWWMISLSLDDTWNLHTKTAWKQALLLLFLYRNRLYQSNILIYHS